MPMLLLQQTLRSLCLKTGWCYAVFWKLKRRSRMVLTWEDGFYEYTMPAAFANLASAPTSSQSPLAGGNGCLDIGGNPLEQGMCGQGGGRLEEQIGLAVARMSYHVYSLGEGIIGRVAFTGKHQWVFAAGENNKDVETYSGGAPNSHCLLEKNQFEAGIKTIAVIAVPQGVVQLGSTQMIMEDLGWVEHIKSVFGTIQGVPGAFLSDMVSERKGGRGNILPLAMPLAEMAASSPSVAVGRPSAAPNVAQPALSNVKGATASALGSLACGSLGRTGSEKCLKQMQVLQPLNDLGDTTKVNLQQSQLQQGFLQPGTCASVVGQEMQASITDVTHSGAGVLQPLTSHWKTNCSLNSNGQMPLLNTPTSGFSFEMMEGRLLKETCLSEHQQVSLTNFTADIPDQANKNTSIDLHNKAPLAAIGIQEQDSNFRRIVSDEFPVIKRSGYLHGVQQLDAVFSNLQTALNVQNEISSSQICSALIGEHGFSQQQLSSQVEDSPSSQSFEGLWVRGCNMPPVQGHGTNQKLCGEVRKPPPSLRNSYPENICSDFLENIVASTVPGQGLPCYNRSVLEQKHLVKDIWGTTIPNCISQDTDESLKHIKSVYKASDPRIPDIPCSVGERDLGGEFDELEKYLNSLSRGQEKKWDRPFAIGDELSQVLSPTLNKGHEKEFWEEIFLQSSGDKVKEGFTKQTIGISGYSMSKKQANMIQSLGSRSGKDELIKGVLGGLSLSESKLEPLLEAIVGSASSNHQSITQSTNDCFSYKKTFSGPDSGASMLNSISKLDSSTAAHNPTAENIYNGYLQHVSKHEDLENFHKTTVVIDSQGMLPLQRSSKDSSPQAVLSTWMEEAQSVKSENAQPSQSKKSDETTKVSRKRARPGESTRPRPKDRQQIQDRVRELREIVPNGSKCSIDALLEKTIKHMLFLQSVTQHADKWKQSGELKVLNNENSLLAQDEMESGASWALAVDGQVMACPIIVKNLSQPRQMLVEMSCEEKGLFLEIADIIQSLGLTILKGILESRTGKIWARFVVEANRDVQRVEILWSLIQLLLPNTKNTSSVTSQADTFRPQSIDIGPGFQQASLPPVHIN